MSTFRLSVRRAVALAAFAVATLFASGCTTYDSYYYDRGDGGDYYTHDRWYDDGYGYYGGHYGLWAYDSVLWPSYRWYDPWYAPGYYYGISWSPSWYGLSFGYHGRSRYGHPWAYHHYSPYRGSWWDNHHYYGGTGWRHGYRDRYSSYRFGSARNEAERLARLEGADRPYARDGEARPARDPGRYGDGALGARTRGFGVPVAPHESTERAPQRGDYSRGIDYGDRAGNVEYVERRREATRDAAWRDGRIEPEYARERGDVRGRDYDWRRRDDGRERDALPETRVLDSRALGGETRARADATPRWHRDASDGSRERTYVHETPTPRYESQPRVEVYERDAREISIGRERSYESASRHEAPAPRYEAPAPRYEAPSRGNDAPSPSRSYDPPSRSEGGERWSREPD